MRKKGNVWELTIALSATVRYFYKYIIPTR